jgi:hypothetical protein
MSVLHGGTPLAHAPQQGGVDPTRLCAYTAVGLLAWILTPPFVVVLMSTLGLIAHARARRAGMPHVNCRLHDARLVVAYLVTAWMIGAWFTVQALG